MKKKNSKAVSTQKILSPTQIAAITQTENMGTAMMQSAQQMFLAVEQVLKEEFSFTQEQLGHFERTITQMMEALAYIEDRGLTVQTIDAMKSVSAVAAHIASLRQHRLKEENSKIALPTRKDLKQLS